MIIEAVKGRLRARSDDELASFIGVSKQAISNWRSRGSIPAKAARLLKLEYDIDIERIREQLTEKLTPPRHGWINYIPTLWMYERIKHSMPGLQDEVSLSMFWAMEIPAIYDYVDAIIGETASETEQSRMHAALSLIQKWSDYSNDDLVKLIHSIQKPSPVADT